MPFTIKKIAMRLRNDSEYIPLPGVRGDAGPAGPGVPAGGTTGQVLAKSSNTDYATEWIDAGGGASMTILSYGNSTWADFIAAYNANSIVYCRASSAADPSSGSQTRLAFMAYVNNASSPTSVEFQYYRSVSSHTDAQQGDQVYIYKLTSGGVWSVTVREAYTKIAAGTNMSSSYDNGTLTLNATGGGGGGTSDYNDHSNRPSINGTTLSGNKTAAALGLGTYSKPSGGIPQTDLASGVQTSLGKADSALQSVPSTYRTAAEQDAIDATQDAAIGIVITGARPSIAVTAGQYVIVRNSTISGITDGLYAANSALSPSTDVTAANLTAVSGGGLNSLSALLDGAFKNITATATGSTTAGENAWLYVPVTIPTGYRMITVNSLRFTGTDAAYLVLRGFEIDNSNRRMTLFFKNTTTSTTINYTATVWITCVKSDLF